MPRNPRYVGGVVRFAAAIAALMLLSVRSAEPAEISSAAAVREDRAAREGSAMTAVATPSFAGVYDTLAADHELRAAVRLVPRGEPLADPTAAVSFIRSHLETWAVTPAALAAALDVRSNVVETLLKSPECIADGPRHTLLRDAESWCRGDARERDLLRARIIPTAVTRLVAGIARTVRATRTVGLVTGSSGLGKSHALEALRGELSGGVTIVRADTDSRCAKGILRAVGVAAGGPAPAAWSVSRTLDELAGGCNVFHGGLLAIDEAHLLSVWALEAVRALFDQAEIGLLLIGTAALGRNIDPQTDPLCGPLVSRVGLRLDLDAELLAPGPDGRPRPWIGGDAVKAILARHVPAALDREALAVLTETANRAPGHLRAAVNAAKVGSVLRRRGDDDGATIRGDAVRAALRLGGVKT